MFQNEMICSMFYLLSIIKNKYSIFFLFLLLLFLILYLFPWSLPSIQSIFSLSSFLPLSFTFILSSCHLVPLWAGPWPDSLMYARVMSPVTGIVAKGVMNETRNLSIYR